MQLNHLKHKNNKLRMVNHEKTSKKFPQTFLQSAVLQYRRTIKNNPDSQCALGKFTSYLSGTDCINGLYKGGNLTRVV